MRRTRKLRKIPTPHFRTGDTVSITYERRQMSGKVLYATPKSSGLILEFDALRDEYAGIMTVWWDGSEFCDELSGNVVKLEKRLC